VGGALHKAQAAATTVLKLARAMAEPVEPYAFNPCPYSADMLLAQEMLSSELYTQLVTPVLKFPVFPVGRRLKVPKTLHPSAAEWRALQALALEKDDETAVAHFQESTKQFMHLVAALQCR
jgi:hypothetical protein